MPFRITATASGSTRKAVAPRSHRRRYTIPTDPPRATLQRSIRLFDRGDEHLRAPEVPILSFTERVRLSRNKTLGVRAIFLRETYSTVTNAQPQITV